MSVCKVQASRENARAKLLLLEIFTSSNENWDDVTYALTVTDLVSSIVPSWAYPALLIRTSTCP